MPDIKDADYFAKPKGNAFVSPFSDVGPPSLYSSIALARTKNEEACLPCAFTELKRSEIINSIRDMAQDNPGLLFQGDPDKPPGFSSTLPVIPEQPIPRRMSIRFHLNRLFVEFRGCMPYIGIANFIRDYPVAENQTILNGSGSYANFSWSFTYDIPNDKVTYFLGEFSGVIWFADGGGTLGFPKPSPVVFPQFGTLYFDEASAYDLNTGEPGDHGCNTYLYISGEISLEAIYAS